ncbi:putative stress-induced protein STI1 [Russula emetica]|nr:putative stress-induced protein STI1 [Russula emetica]
MSEKQQRLVLSIIDFLNQSINDGTVREEDKEGLEVAVQCIGEAFGVDPTDQEEVDRLSVKPATLQTIFEVFLKTRDKISSTGQVPPSTSSAAPVSPSAEDKDAAEKYKQKGNAFMTGKQYDKAIEAYTEATKLDPSNPVYYSNRAAAHSCKGDHLTAAIDAEKVLEIDPKFTKGYSRLGHARYSIGDYAAAADAYRRGLELEPNNAAMQDGLRNSEAQPTDAARDMATPSAASAGGLGGLADTLRNLGGGGAGGAGGAGGMPDLAGMMNNPAMMQMAQQMMANGGLERVMSNPTVASMMDQLNSGGSLPSMEELMANPELRSLASQFAGGQAGQR